MKTQFIKSTQLLMKASQFIRDQSFLCPTRVYLKYNSKRALLWGVGVRSLACLPNMLTKTMKKEKSISAQAHF